MYFEICDPGFKNLFQSQLFFQNNNDACLAKHHHALCLVYLFIFKLVDCISFSLQKIVNSCIGCLRLPHRNNRRRRLDRRNILHRRCNTRHPASPSASAAAPSAPWPSWSSSPRSSPARGCPWSCSCAWRGSCRLRERERGWVREREREKESESEREREWESEWERE